MSILLGSMEGNQDSCFNIFESNGTAVESITPEIILLGWVKLVLWPYINLIFILCILILCVRKKQLYRNEKGYAASELQLVKQSRETRTKPLTPLNLISMVLLYHAYSTSYSLLILVFVKQIKLKPPFSLRQQIITKTKNRKT